MSDTHTYIYIYIHEWTYTIFSFKQYPNTLKEPPCRRSDGPHLALPLPGAQPRNPGHNGTPPEPPKQRRFFLGEKKGEIVSRYLKHAL